MSGEMTMREAVAREVRKFASEPEAATLTATQFILNRDDAIADAAIRTVLERLREPTSAMVEAVRLTMWDHAMSAPRPYHEWTEEVGDVLWWLWPIVDAPYCGTPMDLGYTVEIDLGIASSQRTFEPVETKRSIQIGGWPFDERDDNEGYHRLFWTELPNFDALDVAIRDCIRGEPDEPQPRSMKEHEHG